MNETVITLFYMICSYPLTHLLAYYPFVSFLRFSAKKTTILVSAILLIELYCIYAAIGYKISYRNVEFFFALIFAAFYFYNVCVQKTKILFTYLFTVNYLLVLRGLAGFFTVHVLSLEVTSWQGSLICLCLTGLLFPPMLRFFGSMAHHVLNINAPVWRTVWIIPAFASGIVLLFTASFTKESVGNWKFLVARLSLVACTFVIYYELVGSLNSIRRQAILEEQARQNEQLLNLGRAQYAMLKEHIEETRRARHDLCQHLKLIQAYLDSGDKQALSDYIKNYGESIPMVSSRKYCKNYEVNIILGYYVEQMEAAGIDVELKAALPEQLTISEPDLCVLLGNLLENACNACASLGKNAWVHICIETAGERGIVIVIDNTSQTPPNIRDGNFLSTSHEGAGIGTQSIKNIAARYDGVADFKWENGIFYASVLLNP